MPRPLQNASPVVSVVIPSYNRAKSLPGSVASVLGQTFRDFEVIVVDDGSTDDTSVDEISAIDPRVRLIRHEVNRGAAAARNTGIREAKGKYVAFLDSDDYWLPKKLEVQVKHLESGHGNLFASCTRHFVTFSKDSRTWCRLLNYQRDIRKQLLQFGCDLSPGSTLVVRREIFDSVGYFDENLRRYEDWDWLLRYFKTGTIAIPEEVLALVQLSPPPRSEVLRPSIEVFLDRWKGEARKLGWAAPRRLSARLHIELAKSLMIEQRTVEGINILVRGLLQWPFQSLRSALALARYVRGDYKSSYSVKK
jgi:glycosyltransferase involved in cell wall biosynthesis